MPLWAFVASSRVIFTFIFSPDMLARFYRVKNSFQMVFSPKKKSIHPCQSCVMYTHNGQLRNHNSINEGHHLCQFSNVFCHTYRRSYMAHWNRGTHVSAISMKMFGVSWHPRHLWWRERELGRGQGQSLTYVPCLLTVLKAQYEKMSE